jgi:hypothetical protein
VKNIISLIAGTTLGFLSRPCCSIPFFYSVFGLGSSGLASLIEPYKWIFFFLAVISFSISGYLIFRIHGAVFNKIFFGISVAVTVLFLLVPYVWFEVVNAMKWLIS